MIAEELRRQAFSSLRRIGIVSAIGATISMAAASVARADPVLPSATYELDVDASNPSLSPSDIFFCSGGIGGGAGCAGSPTLQPTAGTSQSAGSLSSYRALATSNLANPANGPLTISASASGTGGTSASGSGQVNYYLELLGPATFGNGTTPILVDLTAHAAVTLSNPLDANAGADASAGIQIWKPVGLNPFSPDGIAYQQVLASFSVFSPGVSVPTTADAAAGKSCPSGQTCVATSDLSTSALFELQPDLQYLITVFATTDTQDSNGASSQTGNASVDPHFFLDPAFDNGLDQLFLSPNANNNPLGGVGAVPEPSTWAMMLLGFAGLGYMGLRQRKRMLAA